VRKALTVVGTGLMAGGVTLFAAAVLLVA